MNFQAGKKEDGEQLEEDVTKPPLTGIPQIDYVWDPNLPRELNGYMIYAIFCLTMTINFQSIIQINFLYFHFASFIFVL